MYTIDRRNWSRLAALSLLVFAIAIPAGANSISLGTASDFGLLMIGTGTADFSHTEGGVFPAFTGDKVRVGLMSGSTLTTSGDPEFWSNVLVATGATLDSNFRSTSGGTNPILGPGTGTTPQGTIYYQTSPSLPLQPWETVDSNVGTILSQAKLDALAAYNAGIALTTSPWFSGITSLTGTTTLNGQVGQNVLNLTGGINLGNAEIVTLNGPPGASFVINVSNEFKFQTGGIRVTGGMNIGDVIYNVIGSVQMTASGGGGGTAVPGLPPAYIVGRVIMPDAASGVGLAPGAIVGQLIFGGDSARFPSGGRIAAVPEPVSVLSFITAAAILCGLARRRKSV